MYNQGKLQNGVKIKGIKKSLAMFENVDDKNIHDIIYIQNNVDVFFFITTIRVLGHHPLINWIVLNKNKMTAK